MGDRRDSTQSVGAVSAEQINLHTPEKQTQILQRALNTHKNHLEKLFLSRRQVGAMTHKYVVGEMS